MPSSSARWTPAATLIAALSFAGPAAGATAPVADGTGTFTVATRAAGGALQDVRLNDGGRSASLPITSGQADFEAATFSKLNLSGHLTFRRGTRSLPIKAPAVVRVGKQRYIAGRLSERSAPTRLVRLSMRKLRSTSGDGASLNASHIALHLTRAGARAFERRLGVTDVRPAASIGTLNVRVDRQLQIRSGLTTLTLSRPAADQITAQRASLVAVSPAQAASGAEQITFVVTGGHLNARTRAGRIEHAGGLRITRGETAYTLSDPTLQIGAASSVSFAAMGQRDALATLNLNAAAFTYGREGVTLDIDGIDAQLTSEGAALLNGAFGTRFNVSGGDQLARGSAHLQVR